MSGEAVAGAAGVGGAVSGLCTLDELLDNTFAVLRDTERSFVTEAEVTTWLNKAYLDLNARLRLKQTKLDGTTTSTGTIAFPSDFIEMISLWFGTVPVTIVDDGVFESWSIPGSTPYVNLARAFNNNIETYPIQVSTAYTLRYVARPTLMVSLTDQPTSLTPELCDRLWRYAASLAKSREGEPQDAQTYMDEYLEGLPGRPRVAHRMRPAPVSLIPQPGPFEV